MNTLGLQAGATAFTDFISKTLTVNSSNVDVTDFSLAPGASISETNTPADFQIQFSISPADSLSPQNVRRSCLVVSYVYTHLVVCLDAEMLPCCSYAALIVQSMVNALLLSRSSRHCSCNQSVLQESSVFGLEDIRIFLYCYVIAAELKPWRGTCNEALASHQ